MGVGVDMEFAQQQLGAFDHPRDGGWGQGPSDNSQRRWPKDVPRRCHSFVAHEAFETNRSGGQVSTPSP